MIPFYASMRLEVAIPIRANVPISTIANLFILSSLNPYLGWSDESYVVVFLLAQTADEKDFAEEILRTKYMDDW